MTEYVMVPVEPTREMIEASGYDYCTENIDAYKAMLAAAPQQAAEPVYFIRDNGAPMWLEARETAYRAALAMPSLCETRILYAGNPPAQPEQPSTQYGWLIENGSNTQTMYRCINNDTGMSIEWTPDANKALRFARREDAQAFAYHDEDAARIAEHAWIAGLTRPAAPGGE